MNSIRSANRGTPRGAVLMATWLATIALSCAPVDDSPAGDGSPIGAAASPSEDAPSDLRSADSAEELEYGLDKALKRDFCCVHKDGNEVVGCTGMNRVGIWAQVTCSYVLRSGKCSKYSDCPIRKDCIDTATKPPTPVPCPRPAEF